MPTPIPRALGLRQQVHLTLKSCQVEFTHSGPGLLRSQCWGLSSDKHLSCPLYARCQGQGRSPEEPQPGEGRGMTLGRRGEQDRLLGEVMA